ncbi:hypothetical protein BGW42_004676 [Actinomortierella wolfii]|nr:hypothetical protein BGW42_004676 [Actinomortierella wolfii]
MSIATNKYNLVLVRHGRSIANEENRIISDPANGAIGDNHPTKVRYGLSSSGKAMVAESAASLADYIDAYSKDDATTLRIHIVCSPFDRTRDTAAIVYKGLKDKWTLSSSSSPSSSASTFRCGSRTVIMDPPQADQDLVERFFGDFEAQAPSTELYNAVWRLDAQDPGHNTHGVESLQQVMARQRRVMQRWAKEGLDGHDGIAADAADADAVESWIIYVGHGDPLQILQTNMQGWALERHRELPHHEVAEWRHVEWCASLAPNYCIAPIEPERRARALQHLSRNS